MPVDHRERAFETAVEHSLLTRGSFTKARLVDLLNGRFGTDFKPADELFWESVREDGSARPDLRQVALANGFESFQLVLKKAGRAGDDRMEQNQEMAARFLNDRPLRALVESEVGRRMYEQIRTPVGPAGSSDSPR